MPSTLPSPLDLACGSSHHTIGQADTTIALKVGFYLCLTGGKDTLNLLFESRTHAVDRHVRLSHCEKLNNYSVVKAILNTEVTKLSACEQFVFKETLEKVIYHCGH